MVRAYWDGNNIYACLSCIRSHLKRSMESSDFYFTIGTSSVRDILEKYLRRGFRIDSECKKYKYHDLFRLEIPKFLFNDCDEMKYYTEIQNIIYEKTKQREITEEEEIILPEKTFDIIEISDNTIKPHPNVYRYPEFI